MLGSQLHSRENAILSSLYWLVQVFADSYAQRAGVQKDDLIVQVDGNRVDTCDVFLQVRPYREEGEERKGEEGAEK